VLAARRASLARYAVVVLLAFGMRGAALAAGLALLPAWPLVGIGAGAGVAGLVLAGAVLAQRDRTVLAGLVFGLAIPLISVHMGLRTKGGAEGVGRTTTQAVMFMTLTILILDALFPPLMLQ